MDYNLPMSINCEKDLQVYENYLKKTEITNINKFENHLKNNQGKLVKIEILINSRLQTRIGILMEVGTDFLIIKPTKDCVSTIIKLDDIKYITIVHDNDRKKAMLQ